MAAGVPGKDARKLKMGFKVDRAAAVLPATTNQNLFAVTTGRIIVTGLVGEVTTVGSATATNAKFRSAPTVGTAADLCANALVTSAAVGTQLTISGLFADALIVSTGAGQILDSVGLVIPVGNIQITTDATNTGAVKYTLFYVPLDDGGTAVAV